MTLEGWLKPARVLIWLAGGVLTVSSSAFAAYYGATSKVERGAERTEQVAESLKSVADALAAERAERQQADKEQQTAMDARFSAMEAQRQADEAARQKDREELIRIGVTLGGLQRDSQETRGDLKVLLDRLNAGTRTRTARDYSQ